MIDIGLYHWLPLAENMFPEIENALRRMERNSLSSDSQKLNFFLFTPTDSSPDKKYFFTVSNIVYTSSDGITYEAEWQTELGALVAFGKINHIGFAQNITTIPIADRNLQEVIEESQLRFSAFITSLLIEILPQAAQNKVAVLCEGILSPQSFEAGPIEEDFVPSAKAFLNQYRILTIHLGNRYQEGVSNLSLSSLKLNTSPRHLPKMAGFNSTNTQLVAIGEKEAHFQHPSTLLFFNSSIATSKSIEIDDVFFQYCALIIFSECLFLSINILKRVRDYVTRVRRELVVSLHQNTEDHFPRLTKVKKYLTYVDIKIPVIGKVKNHIQSITGIEANNIGDSTILGTHNENAYFKRTIADRLVNIDEITETLDFEIIIGHLNQEALGPSSLKDRIYLGSNRLVDLYREEEREVDVLSTELSQVLNGSLLAENVKLLSRELDTSRAALELDRGAKNRSNALMFLSIITSASFGFTIGGEIGNLVNIIGHLGNYPPSSETAALIVMGFKALCAGLAYWGASRYTSTFINRRSRSYRLVIPINKELPVAAIRDLTFSAKSSPKLMDSNANRRLRAWSQSLGVQYYRGPKDNRLEEDYDDRIEFVITVDYEKRGFVHYIMLETEAEQSGFKTLPLVKQIMNLLHNYGCLAPYHMNDKLIETSLYIEALTQLGVYLDEKLPALNRILTTRQDVLARELEALREQRTTISLSEEDQAILNDLIDNFPDYIAILESLEKDALSCKLVGQENINRKKPIIAEYGGRYSIRRPQYGK